MTLRDPQNNMCSKGASRVYVLQHSSDKLFGSQLQLLYWIPRCNPAIGKGTWSRRAVTYAHRPRFRQVRYHVQKRTTKRTYSWRYWTETQVTFPRQLLFSRAYLLCCMYCYRYIFDISTAVIITMCLPYTQTYWDAPR